MGKVKSILFFYAIFLFCCTQIGATQTPEAERDFNRILVLSETGRESEAIVSVTDFLRRHPEHPLSDDAQFLLGEIYFKQRNFSLALAELKKVLNSKSQNNDRIADSGVLMGECWKFLKEPQKARIEWEAVTRRFPNSPAAKKAELHLMGEK